MTKWQRILDQPCIPMGKDGRLITASPADLALSRSAATEGMVLLKKRNFDCSAFLPKQSGGV